MQFVEIVGAKMIKYKSLHVFEELADFGSGAP